MSKRCAADRYRYQKPSTPITTGQRGLGWASEKGAVASGAGVEGVLEHVGVHFAFDDDVQRPADAFEAFGAGVGNHRDSQARGSARHDPGMVERERSAALADRAAHAFDRDINAGGFD